MAYEEQEAKRSRLVVETPTARREVVESESIHRPERNGVSGATVGVIVVVAVALVTILVLFLLSGQQSTNENANLAAQQPAPVPQTTIIQQPAPQQQPPIIVQQPAPATQQAPVIINPPASGTTNATDDSAIQAEIDRRIADDRTLSSLGITITVLGGKATLIGTVNSEALKQQFERVVRQVKGVKSIDNQITVITG